MAFGRLAEPHRAELQLHCYRMLGSLHDAEDLVQETMLRAWRAVGRFRGDTSFRRWLYRIATNVCLDALARRATDRRVLPDALGAATTERPDRPATEIAWLEPYPDAALAGVPDDTPGPDARYELRESVQLAFVAAIQLLPPRQRAALLLRDVLGLSAAETARVLDSSVASVNSALQRARAALEQRATGFSSRLVLPTDAERALLARYVESWERNDVDALIAVLREDAVLTMPPWREWYRGRDAIAAFFSWTARPGGRGPFRLLPTAANGQPALAFYGRMDGQWRAHSIQVLHLVEGRIAVMTSFVTPALFEAFGLPATIPD